MLSTLRSLAAHSLRNPLHSARHTLALGGQLGRVLLGVLSFVFCPAHLALLVHWPQSGLLELYGVLVLSAELPQRLVTGRSAQGPESSSRTAVPRRSARHARLSRPVLDLPPSGR